MVMRLLIVLSLLVTAHPATAAYLHFSARFTATEFYYANVNAATVQLSVSLSDTACSRPLAIDEPAAPNRQERFSFATTNYTWTNAWCYQGMSNTIRMVGLYGSAGAGTEVTLHVGDPAFNVPSDTTGDCKSAQVLMPHSGLSGIRTCKTASNGGFVESGPSFVPLSGGGTPGFAGGSRNVRSTSTWAFYVGDAQPIFLNDGVGAVSYTGSNIQAPRIQYIAGFDDRPIRYLVYRATLNTGLSQVDDNYLVSSLQIADSCPSSAVYYPSINYLLNTFLYYQNTHCIAGVPDTITMTGANGSTLTLHHGDPAVTVYDSWGYFDGSKAWHYFGIQMPDGSLFLFAYCAYVCAGQRLVGMTPYGQHTYKRATTNSDPATEWRHDHIAEWARSTYRWDLH